MLVSPGKDLVELQEPLAGIGNTPMAYNQWYAVFEFLLMGWVYDIVYLPEVWQLSLNFCCCIDEEVWEIL